MNIQSILKNGLKMPFLSKAQRNNVKPKVSSKEAQSIIAKIDAGYKDRTAADIRKWRQAVNSATDPNNPNLAALHDLFENLRDDGHFISQVNLRKAGSLAVSFSIKNDNGEKNDELTALFQSEWFYNLMSHVLDSVFYGYTLLEFGKDGERPKFSLVPRRNVVPTKKIVLTNPYDTAGISYNIGYENSLVEVGEPASLGLLSHLCYLLIFKRNAIQSWAEFSERFGIPMVVIKTNQTNPKELDKLEQAANDLGESSTAVVPEGSSVEIQPFVGSDSFKVYLNQIELMNAEISKAITGGTMVSDDGSSRSQSEVHERNLDDKITAMDRLLVEFVVNDQVLPLLKANGFNIPDGTRFSLDKTFELSVKEHWYVVSNALAYFDIPTKWISENFNMPIDRVRATPLNQAPILNQLSHKPENSNSILANFR